MSKGMFVSGVIQERFSDYRKPALMLLAPTCTWKCCTESGIPPDVCINNHLCSRQQYFLSVEEMWHMYSTNPITCALLFGGLEPMDSIDGVLTMARYFRAHTRDDIVVYTGYTHLECASKLGPFRELENMIFKFGRYQPGDRPHVDRVLGVPLASDNQYAIRIGEFD